MKDYHLYNMIEDFLFDDEFNRLVKANNPGELEKLKEAYPEHKDLMQSAAVLIAHMKVKEIPLSEDYLEEKYGALKESVRRRKRMLHVTRYAAAACFLAVLVSSFFFYRNREQSIDRQLLARLDTTSFHVGEISLSSGYTHVEISEDKEIVQASNGDILVGDEEKVKSSDIEDEYVQLTVPNGKRTSINFNDGTVAWVNSGSKLIYPKSFKQNKREIYIDGEVFLQVAKEKNRPFIVRSKDLNVTVLGTRFNISAYSNDKVNSVVLVDGLVVVSSGKQKSRISPNQGFFHEEGQVSIKEVDVYKYICWKEGVIKLENETLEAIFKKIGRYYNVMIEAGKSNLDMNKEIYKGKLDLNDSLQIVLDNLAHSSHFSYKIKEGAVYIE